MTTSASILLVEDERITRKNVGHMLTDLGHCIQIAESGEQGMNIFEPDTFDVVLSDVDMPGIDGIEMLEQMKSLDSTIVPVIMTARRDQETAVRAIDCGVKSFLTKPFTQENLKIKIEEAVVERKRTVETRLLIEQLNRTKSDLQEKMMERERYLDHLINSAPFAVVSVGDKDQILTFNGMAERLYGYAHREIVGHPASILFGESTDVRPSSKSYHVRQDGEMFPVLMHRQDILNERHQCIAHLYIVEDLSEREQLEAQLLYAERLSLLGQLAPRIAHEFKTPLQGILGQAEMVLAWLKQGKTAEARLAAERILPSGRQMNDLVNQLTNLGKPAKSTTAEIDLGVELNRVIDTLKNLGVVKYCRIVQTVEENLPQIQGDPSQLEQVFRNLIVNGVHAMEGTKNPTLILSLKTSPDRRYVQGIVEDTGSGIAPENLERIFQPFFTTKAEGKGTGLGLPIIKTIIDNHEGEITVESKLGKGTRFIFSFPAFS